MSFKQDIWNTPHRLIHWAPMDLDRRKLEPFRDVSKTVACAVGLHQAAGGQL